MTLNAKPVSVISFPSVPLSSGNIIHNDLADTLDASDLERKSQDDILSPRKRINDRKTKRSNNTNKYQIWRSLQNSPSSFTSHCTVLKNEKTHTTVSQKQVTKLNEEKQNKILDPWIDNLTQCHKINGKINIRTAECMSQLGHAYMRLESYSQALAVFKNVVRVRRALHGNDHLSVGRALDCVGRAAAASDELEWAVIALYEALTVRYRILGPWNADVADTLNNIAGIFYRKNEMVLAQEAYEEVLAVRRAVFGENHPSVAVTATCLGRIYLRRSRLDEAVQHFNEALRIYRVCLNLSDTSKIVSRVLKNISRAERLMVSFDCLCH